MFGASRRDARFAALIQDIRHIDERLEAGGESRRRDDCIEGFARTICEDGTRVQRLQGLTRDGRIITLARNNIVLNGQKHGFIGDFSTREWAGVTYSPDGKWLFANIQVPGVTFAITGPWSDGAL